MFEKKTKDTGDSRHVAICKKIQERCDDLLEEAWKAVEADDFTQAAGKIELGQKLNSLFMITMKRGMEVADEKAKAQTEAPKTN